MALTPAEVANSNYLVTDSDYETILSVIMESARGRWFLAEHARRNRRSDIQMILTKISKLKCNHDDLFDFNTVLSNQTHS